MRIRTKEIKLHIPLTHMADIAYLLLIFIIILSLINTSEKVPESLPVSSTGVEVNKESHTLYMTDNEFIFNNETYNDLQSLTTELKENDKGLAVTIIADKDIYYGRIKSILRVLKEQAYHDIAFLVLKK
jgi:biopolymer transport protein ExbD